MVLYDSQKKRMKTRGEFHATDCHHHCLNAIGTGVLAEFSCDSVHPPTCRVQGFLVRAVPHTCLRVLKHAY